MNYCWLKTAVFGMMALNKHLKHAPGDVCVCVKYTIYSMLFYVTFIYPLHKGQFVFFFFYFLQQIIKLLM